MEKESHLLEELEKLSLTLPRGSRERPQTPRCFTPLLDIPVDGYNAESGDLRPSSSSPMLPNWLLARSGDSQPPLRTDIGTIRSVHFDEVSLHSAPDRVDSERGRSLFRNGRSKSKSGDRSRETVFTLQSAARRTRPLLSGVFGSDRQMGGEQMNGHRVDNGAKYELKTVSISKTKQSLGKHTHTHTLHRRIRLSPLL